MYKTKAPNNLLKNKSTDALKNVLTIKPVNI